MRPHLTRPVLAGAAVVALLIGAGAYLVFGGPGDPVAEATASPSPSPSPTATPRPTRRPTPTPSPSPTPTPAAVCPVNGLPTAHDGVAERAALLVQIENHPDARPASNLNLADLVVEAPVEGDTTRFSALFLCNDTEELTGPVRSARYYNVDLWQDLHVLTVGCGASDGALARFANAGMPYVNGITGVWPWFGRVSGRAAPHNLYSDLGGLRDAIGANAALDAAIAAAGEFRPPFAVDADAEVPDGRPVTELTIQTNSFWVFGWSWHDELETWTRSDAGVAIEDAVSGEPVSARSVIVQRVTQSVVFGDPDPGGNPRREQHLVGEGNGTLYVDGRAVDLTWSRPSADAQTEWRYAESGEEVVLPPGRIWWEIVPVGASVIES